MEYCITAFIHACRVIEKSKGFKKKYVRPAYRRKARTQVTVLPKVYLYMQYMCPYISEW